MVSNSLNVFIAPLKSSFFIIHLIINAHFRIEPFQKACKNFLSFSTKLEFKGKSFFKALV